MVKAAPVVRRKTLTDKMRQGSSMLTATKTAGASPEVLRGDKRRRRKKKVSSKLKKF